MEHLTRNGLQFRVQRWKVRNLLARYSQVHSFVNTITMAIILLCVPVPVPALGGSAVI
jgi:hypothetical protein